MSHVNIWVHAVWGTKNRVPLLSAECLNTVCKHIRRNALQKDFYVDEVNGYNDHLHCLMKLKADWSIVRQMQMIKGESSNWINKNGIIRQRLEWADEYFAASVSERRLGWVRNYIRNQEEHHRKISFADEYAEFLKTFGGAPG
jgi:putative transposase